jgi:hypothetical protein
MIWVFIAYLSINEVRQCIISGFISYISNIWNYMDMSLIALIVIAEVMIGRFKIQKFTGKEDLDYEKYSKIARTLYSFAAIIMWIRFLYFFRIFRNTGYYIRMLVNVI